MPGKRKPTSLGKIRDAVRHVRRNVAKARVHPEHRYAQKATLNFLDGLDGVVSSFCLRLSDGNPDTLDAMRPRQTPRLRPKARRRSR
jgi:hypothetical protein